MNTCGCTRCAWMPIEPVLSFLSPDPPRFSFPRHLLCCFHPSFARPLISPLPSLCSPSDVRRITMRCACFGGVSSHA